MYRTFDEIYLVSQYLLVDERYLVSQYLLLKGERIPKSGSFKLIFNKYTFKARNVWFQIPICSIVNNLQHLKSYFLQDLFYS